MFDLSSKLIESPCRICGKLIKFGNMIQRMGWYCDDCAGYAEGKTLCQCCVNGDKDCPSKDGKDPCGYTPHYKFRKVEKKTEFCTKKEIASYLKVTERTIDRLRKTGLPCIKIRNKILRFDKEDVLMWLKLNSQDAVSKFMKSKF